MTAPLRILAVSPVGEAGGAETLLLTVLEQMSARGHHVLLVAHGPGPLVDAARARGLGAGLGPPFRVSQPASLLAAARGLRRTAAAFAPHVVLAEHPKAHLLAVAAGLPMRRRGVLQVFDPPDPADRLESLLRRLPTCRVAIMARTADGYRQSRGGRPLVVTPGVDVPAVRGAAEVGVAARVAEAAGLTGGPADVVMVSRLQRFKGPADFLELARRLPTTAFALVGPDAPGDPGLRAELQRTVDREGLAGRVGLAGYVDRADLAAAVAAARCLVHPAAEETFGLSVLEAMAVGTPVVAYAGSGPSVLLAHGGGVLVPPGDVDGLVRAVRGYLDDPTRADRDGQAGATAALDYDSGRLGDRWEAVLTARAAGRRPVLDRPRPLHIGTGWPPAVRGGLVRYLADLVAAQQVDGLDAQAVVPGPTAGAPGVHGASTPAGSLWRRLVTMRREVARALPDADVVDAHFALYAAPTVLTGGLRGRPLIVHFQGPWAEESAAVGAGRAAVWAKRRLERAVYRRADRLVVLSQPFREILIERYGVQRDRIHVIPPGVDLARFAPGSRPDARRRLGLPDGPLVVTVRRLVPRMGIDVLVRALAEPPLAEARLVVAGDGPARPDLERLVAQLGLADRVRFLGTVEDADLPDLYRAADVAAVPSRALEGFGLVVLEALACGTPVVATRVGGLPEALAGLDPALLVDPDDPAGLAHALASVLGGRGPDPVGCRQHAQRWSWPSAVARLDRVYGAAAGQAATEARLRSLRQLSPAQPVDVFQVPTRHRWENALHRAALGLRRRPATEPVAMVLWAGWLAVHMSQNPTLGRRLPQAILRQALWQSRRRMRADPLTVDMAGGYRLVLPAHSHMAGTTWATGLHEPREQLFALAYLRPGDTVVDVGANIGIFTALFASTGAQVLAFEPGSRSLRDLARTIAENPSARVTVVPAALSDTPGQLALTLDLESSNHLIADDAVAAAGGMVELVDVMRLDDYLNPAPATLDLVKIDAEGFDLNVLRGAETTLRTHRPALLVETWGSSEIRDWLEARGYRLYRYAFERRELVEYPTPFTRPANIVAVHEARLVETCARLRAGSEPALTLPRRARA